MQLNVLRYDLSQEPLIFLFLSLYKNRVSNALRFISEQFYAEGPPIIFLEKFAFRLVYELSKRDYLNKAMEVIKAMGWK